MAGSQYLVSITQIFESEAKLRMQDFLPLTLNSNTFGALEIQVNQNDSNSLENAENVDYSEFDLNISESDFSVIESYLPVLTYLSGYCARSAISKLNCDACTKLLILEKSPSLHSDYVLVKNLDRGGLFYPTPDVVTAVAYNYVVVKKLINEKNEKKFLKQQNQRGLVINISEDLICEQNIFLNGECCSNGHMPSDILKFILRPATNTFLNNYCAQRNDAPKSISKSKQRKWEMLKQSSSREILSLSEPACKKVKFSEKILKANSVITEHVNAPSWLHKYIIGKKGANIKQITSDLTKVQVDFADGHDTIKVEGPPEEVREACRKLREMTENLKAQVAYEEIKIKPAFHRHIIGKNGANINRLKDETKALINIPSDDSDIVRIEGEPEGVAQVKKFLLEMVHKMENEVTKEVIIEQRFHRNIIGAKGEKIREIRDKFNQVNITFPEPGLKSDKVIIRGPKPDVDACYKHLQRLHEDMKINNFSVDVPIYKQNHKFIIGKGGANIKKINVLADLKTLSDKSDKITKECFKDADAHLSEWSDRCLQVITKIRDATSLKELREMEYPALVKGEEVVGAEIEIHEEKQLTRSGVITRYQSRKMKLASSENSTQLSTDAPQKTDAPRNRCPSNSEVLKQSTSENPADGKVIRSGLKRKSSGKNSSNKKQKLNRESPKKISKPKRLPKKIPSKRVILLTPVIVPSTQRKRSVNSKIKRICEEIKKKEEKSNYNIQRALAERQQKAELNKKNLEEKRKKVLQKRLQIEKEKEERLQQELGMKLFKSHATKKTNTRELTENDGKENKSLVSDFIKLNETYSVKATAKEICPKKSHNSDCYELTPVSDSSTYNFSDDEEDVSVNKPIPNWAKGIVLKNLLIQQVYCPVDPKALFGNNVENPDLEEIFELKNVCYKKRTSSAAWNSSFRC